MKRLRRIIYVAPHADAGAVTRKPTGGLAARCRSLTYTVSSSQYVINYQIGEDGTCRFEFVDPSGKTTTLT